MNNTMVDVALGLTLLYAVLSLLVTTLQEYLVNSGLRWRSRHMKKTVRSAFGESAGLTESFFAHPLIVSLADGKGGRAPSYLPDDVFAKVFLAVLGQGTHPKASGMSPESFLSSIAGGGADRPSEIVRSLRLATAGNTGDWQAFEASVARWFHDIGERSRGWFKRSTQRWVLLISLAVAAGLNIDSVLIARTLWSDGELRRQLADVAVSVNESLRAAGGAPTAVRAGMPAQSTVQERHAEVENGLRALALRLKEDAFLQERSFSTITCEAVPARCVQETIVGDHCRTPAVLALTPAPSCAPGAGSRRPLVITPADLWLDQVHRLADELQAGRSRVTARGGALELDDGLQQALATVQRTLAAIASDMAHVELKTPDPKSRQARILESLRQDVQALQERIGQLFRHAPVHSRTEIECRLLFGQDPRAQEACRARQSAQTPFGLPMGFDSSVLIRQMSHDALLRCSQQSCGTWSMLLGALLNGAWIGWLLTALALSLGAPFWFDTLGRIAKLRAAGSPAGTDTPEQGPARRSPPGPTSVPGSPSAPIPAPASGSDGTGTADIASRFEATLSQDEIRDLQRKLNVAPTGVFDRATRSAIAARRARLGRPAGAEVDGALYEAIIERRSPSVESRPLLQPDQRHDLVPEVRKQLADLLGIPERARGEGDGFDAPLRAAVRLFQGRAGLAPDGIIGEQTWRILDAGGGAAQPADAWMRRAIQQLGLDETTDKDEVRKFLAVLGEGAKDPAQLAWCGCFVAWAVQDLRPRLPTAAAAAMSWHRWGTEAPDNRYGAVVLLEETDVRRGAVQRHVGLLVGRTPQGWVVLGGNQGKQGTVSVALFAADTHQVLWCGMPDSAPAA